MKTRNGTDSPKACLPVQFISRCDLHLCIPVPNSLRNQTSYLQHSTQTNYEHWTLRKNSNKIHHFTVKQKDLQRTHLKIFNIQMCLYPAQDVHGIVSILWEPVMVGLCKNVGRVCIGGNKVKVWHLKGIHTYYNNMAPISLKLKYRDVKLLVRTSNWTKTNQSGSTAL